MDELKNVDYYIFGFIAFVLILYILGILMCFQERKKYQYNIGLAIVMLIFLSPIAAYFYIKLQRYTPAYIAYLQNKFPNENLFPNNNDNLLDS